MQRLARRFRPLQFLFHGAETLMMLLFWGVAALLPAAAASRFGAALVSRIGPRLAKNRHVRRNLRIALPERDERQRRVLERSCWATLGAVLGEMPHLARLRDPSRRPPAVELRLAPGAEDLLERLKQGEAFLFATAHLANWELLPGLLAQKGGRMAVVYTAQGNPFVDLLLQWLRRRDG